MSRIRQRRTAEQIKNILSTLVLRDLRDPRLQDLTITIVRLDREMQYADIFVNALADESRETEVMDALNGAKGYLRRELASRLDVRTVPQLHFHWDPTLEYAQRIDQLLESLDIPPETEEDEA
jgi:ribosome-binding factor A